MNQQEMLQKIGDWIAKTTEQISDFAAKEVPPFILEYLQWKFWENVVGIVQYGLLVILSAILAFISYKWTVKLNKVSSNGDAAFATFIMCLAFSLVVLFYGVGGFPSDNIKDCIQIKIAPKVYLVEKAAELYKQSKQ